MNRKIVVLLLVSLLWFTRALPAVAAPDTTQARDSLSHPKKEMKGAVVAPFGMSVFNIYTRLGPFSPEERAKAIEKKLKVIADDPFYRSDSIRLIEGETTCDIMYRETVITTVNDGDARAEGATRALVAGARQAKIIYAIQNFRTINSFGEILRKVAISAGILLLLIVLITLINKLFRYLKGKTTFGQNKIMKTLHLQDYAFFNRQRQLAILHGFLKVVQWLLILILLIVTLLTIFFLLPWTKAISIGILGFVINPLKDIIFSFWKYIPNLITILVIIFVARLIIKLFRFLKVEVEKETLRFPGFYADWALPTFNILRVLIIIFTIVAIWPYLPGSGSQIFQGVSVFAGLVFSLTSASALSNFMAGLTITYTRAFKLGDRVKIGEVTGDIIEKSMLVTKIRTIKNEEITVPNTKIMNSEVINYSTCAHGHGLIVHTTVTIGYDAPWRQVHQLLIDAALQTSLILETPAPFVLQTALNDFYISYQLNAYTRSPNQMAQIFSDLHQHIQDSFNNAGVEIMSPHYKAVRDGNTIAIPEENRETEYTPPSFRVDSH
ncbi:MAG: mechanosensitive ion channel family protein [Bacteroidota bacterium]